MSATFTRRAKYLTFAGLATLGLAAVAQLAVTPIASSADTYSVPLHNTTTPNTGGCEEPPGDNQTGWHFVLPTNDADFVSVTITFSNGTSTYTVTAPGPNGLIGPPSAKHAYVYSVGADDTIVSGTAEVTGGDADKFVLSHHCVGTQESPSPSPSESPSATPSESPSESPSATPSESPSESPSTTPSESPSETPSVAPTTIPPTTVPPTTVPPTTEAPSESPSETPSAEVSGTVIESPSETPSESTSPTPTVLGERETRGPSALPTTGSVLPVGLLLILGFGLVGAGVVATVAGETPATSEGGKHRR